MRRAKLGDRIKVTHLVRAENEPSINPGDKGTVIGALDRVSVKFDNGSELYLLPEDDFVVIENDGE